MTAPLIPASLLPMAARAANPAVIVAVLLIGVALYAATKQPSTQPPLSKRA